MTDLGEHLRVAISDLYSIGAHIALVGGLAVSARAEPRMTRDADLALSVTDDADAERLVLLMEGLGYSVLAAVEQEAVGRLSTVRLMQQGSATITDLLFASTGIEPEVVLNATAVEILPGLVIPVATVGYLIAMKLLARDDRNRPADADDLRALRIVATDRDWEEARSAVTLIQHRGYSRERDLTIALDTLRVDGPY
jgi:predicted nucleotidyltransferase